MALIGVKALVFDVFGTVVDWRSGVRLTASTRWNSPTPGVAGMALPWKKCAAAGEHLSG